MSRHALGPKHFPIQAITPAKGTACEQEWKLRDEILDWCDKQWPRWRVIWARDDKKSTLPIGAPDLVVAASDGRTFYLELKARHGKQSPEQVVWEFELKRLKQLYFVIRSMDEFLEAIQTPNQQNP